MVEFGIWGCGNYVSGHEIDAVKDGWEKGLSTREWVLLCSKSIFKNWFVSYTEHQDKIVSS